MDKKRLANIFDKTKIKYPRLTIGEFKIKVQESEDINIKSATIRYVNSYLMFTATLPSDTFDKFLKWFKKSNKIFEIKETQVRKNRVRKMNKPNPNADVLKVFQRAYGINFSKNSIKKNKPKKYSNYKSTNDWKRIKSKWRAKKKTVTARDKYFQHNYAKTYGMLGLSVQCPSCFRMLYQTKICSRCN